MAKPKSGSEEEVKAVSAAGGMRMEEAKSKRKRKPKVSLTVEDINPASGFVEWLRQNAVVGLAIGFVVGTQVQVVVKQLITSFIDPLFTLLFGNELNTRAFSLSFHGREVQFTWGAFVYTLINFLFILLTIFVIIKLLKLDKLDKPKK
jgi:large conductance mechanosensitive channel protein